MSGTPLPQQATPVKPVKSRLPLIIVGLTAAVGLAGGAVWYFLHAAPACPVTVANPTAQDFLNAGRALRLANTDDADDRTGPMACFLDACDANVQEGCRLLGETFEEKAASPGSLAPRLVDRFNKNCDSGDVSACHALAVMYRDGKGQPADPALALSSFRKLCEMKSISVMAASTRRTACLDQMQLAAIQNNGAGSTKALATGCLKSSAACRSLAIAFERGAGLMRDPFMARRLYDWSCRLEQPGWDADHLDIARPAPRVRVEQKPGAATAAAEPPAGPPCFDLDDLDAHLTSHATEASAKCEGGDANACLDAAAAIVAETDDPVRASKELQKGCEAGLLVACAHYGEALRDSGEFGPAFEKFSQACTGNSTFACDWLGYMQFYGEVNPNDRAAAKASYDKSCQLGTPHACVESDMLSSG